MVTTTRRTPALTKQAREIAEAVLFEENAWPWTSDQRFRPTGLSPNQIRDALWAHSADEWRRGVLRRYARRSEQLCP